MGFVRKILKGIFAFMVALVAVGILGHYALPLPDISERSDTLRIPKTAETRLGALSLAGMERHPGKSGVAVLGTGYDALASRIVLAEAAEQSLDVQYYIWHADSSGLLLLNALRDAADRGVRVRLLLDDNGVPGLDPLLAALDARPNFDIRLFNPSTVRSPKSLGYLFDPLRMNRRMHNKAFIADGAAAIIGGRNIGDEYFQVKSAMSYVDLDAIALGEVVGQTSEMFDAYWNSASSFDLDELVEDGDPAALKVLDDQPAEGDFTKVFVDQVASSVAALRDGALTLEWTDVALVADDPAKGQGSIDRDRLMIGRLQQILGKIETRLDLVSAYFVPGEGGTGFLSDLLSRGVEVRILTNALDTTDVLMVHSGYSKYRRDLLEAGADLYELKLGQGQDTEEDFQLKPLGVSGASLHAKTFAVDGNRIFIGSFNFDPRSAMLNCEMGFLIDSAALADRVHSYFDTGLAEVSYRPSLTPEGNMVWRTEDDTGRMTIFQREPGATWIEQITLVIIGVLPIEWLL